MARVRNWREHEEAMYSVSCPLCGSKKGHPCRGTEPRPARGQAHGYTHVARRNLAALSGRPR